MESVLLTIIIGSMLLGASAGCIFTNVILFRIYWDDRNAIFALYLGIVLAFLMTIPVVGMSILALLDFLK